MKCHRYRTKDHFLLNRTNLNMGVTEAIHLSIILQNDINNLQKIEFVQDTRSLILKEKLEIYTCDSATTEPNATEK